MENHESYSSVLAVACAKILGIMGHKMQFLVHTIFGPFKTFNQKAVIDWMFTQVNQGNRESLRPRHFPLKYKIQFKLKPAIVQY